MRKIAYLAATTMLTASYLGAQVQNGSLTGTVTDATGAVVAGAQINVTNLATGIVRSAKSDGAGVYDIEGLQPSQYKVSVSAEGFATTETGSFTVAVGSSNKLNAQLALGQADTKVEVTANSVAGINLENAENSQVVDQQQVLEFPTQSRDPYAFVSLVGNASSDPSGTNRGVGVNISGARSASTEILLDGIENTYLFSVGVATRVPVDAVQEYRVLTSNYGPEYGRASGGVVNVVTRSGSNAFHGTAWEFYRPSTFASVSTYNKAYGNPLRRFVRNEFGFVVGGPIKKDKLFFFGGNEWLRVRSSNFLQYLVPTTQFINMSSSATQAFFNQYGTLTATPLGSPLTLGQIGGGTGAVSTAFATDRKNLEALPGGGFTDNTPIFQLVQVVAQSDAGGGTPQNTYNSIGRIDFTPTDRTQMYGRYVLYNEVDPVGAGNVSPYQGYNTGASQKSQNLVYGLTHTFNNHWTSQTQIGLLRININQPLGERPAGPTLFLNSSSFSLTGKNVVFPGYNETSASNGLPSGGPQNNIVVSPFITYTKGRHTISFGGQYTYIRDNHTFAIYENAQESLVQTGNNGSLLNFRNGVFNYFQANIDSQGKYPCTKNLTTGQTPGITAGTSFDPSCTITTPISQPQFGRSNRYQEGALFFDEQWKATPRLTLNAGLRYELYGTQHNKNPNLDSNFYFGTSGTLQDRIRAGKILRTTDTAPIGVQNPNGRLWAINFKQFAPRLSFAYDLTGDGKTSLRGGYGISYERNFGNVTYNVALNPPGQFAISITNLDNGGASFPISTGSLGPFSSQAGLQKALPQATVRAVNPRIAPAYGQFYTLGLERQVLPSLALGVTYTGERGIHNYSIANYNRSYYGQVYENDAARYTTGAVNTNRLNPQYTSINVRGADGDSYYNAVNVRSTASNLAHSGISLTANYTYGHSTDNTSATFASDGGSNGVNVGGVAYFDPYNHALDHGNSDFDIKHRISLGLIYSTPAFGTTGFTRAAIAGWEVSTTYIANTGTPFTMYDSSLPAVTAVARAHFNTPVNRQRIRASTPVAGSPDYYNYIDFPARTVNGAPNTAAYSNYVDPKIGAADLPTIINGYDTFGNMSARNTFRGPGAQTFNAALNKTIKLTDRYGLQLRAELYNVLNHPNEYLNLGGSNDVAITPYIETYKNVGSTTGANRQLQLAGKFSF